MVGNIKMPHDAPANPLPKGLGGNPEPTPRDPAPKPATKETSKPADDWYGGY